MFSISGGEMRGKATLILFLMVLVCHVFSAHFPSYAGSDHLDGVYYNVLPKECKLSVCHDGKDEKCFCCLATPDSPCWLNEDECKKVCSQVEFPPPSVASGSNQ
uniref:Uncharacterized protein n=1 Tax=Hordeum vulgare subsp. vulgare TaxID=112509 RepID=A0A8I6Z0C3_HORVV